MTLPAPGFPAAAATAFLLLALPGCAGTEAAQTFAVPCNSELLLAANYLDNLYDLRSEQSTVIRFDSEAAMNSYNDQTRQLRFEALRLGEALVNLGEQAGLTPDYTPAPTGQPTLEGANAVIAAADACVAAVR
ncbi:MAG: hypothetical protein ACO33A_12855 [Hyphomonas sp.]